MQLTVTVILIMAALVAERERAGSWRRICLLLSVFRLPFFAVAADGVAGGGLPDNPLSPTQILHLFNGTNLNGLASWLVDSKGEDPRGVFSVVGGMIRVSGDGLGYLGTQATYANYRVVTEYRWGRTNWAWGHRVGRARDSGLFLHAVGPDGNSHDGQGAFMAAIECNVFQGATGDFLLIRGTDRDGLDLAPRLTATVEGVPDPDGWPYWSPMGIPRTIERWGRLNWLAKDRAWADRTDFRGAKDVESPLGEWTRLECVCDRDRMEVRVNGKVVNAATGIWPRAGRILLQCEGSEIFFRRLELHPLTPAP